MMLAFNLRMHLIPFKRITEILIFVSGSFSKLISSNHNLLSLINITGDSANNYTCIAQNALGNDTLVSFLVPFPSFFLT